MSPLSSALYGLLAWLCAEAVVAEVVGSSSLINSSQQQQQHSTNPLKAEAKNGKHDSSSVLDLLSIASNSAPSVAFASKDLRLRGLQESAVVVDEETHNDEDHIEEKSDGDLHLDEEEHHEGDEDHLETHAEEAGHEEHEDEHEVHADEDGDHADEDGDHHDEDEDHHDEDGDHHDEDEDHHDEHDEHESEAGHAEGDEDHHDEHDEHDDHESEAGHAEGDEDHHDEHDEHDEHDDHESEAGHAEGDEDHHDDHEHGHEGHAEEEEEGHDDHDHGLDHSDEHSDEFSTLSASAASENSNEEKKPWGTVIGATLLVNLAALVGVVFLVPTVLRSKLCCGMLGPKKRSNRKNHLTDIMIPSFGAGALLAAAVFLILPEAHLLIMSGAASMLNASTDDHGEDAHGDHDDHSDHGHRYLQDGHEGHGHEGEVKGVEWKFGSAILGGFLIPMVLGAAFPRSHEHVCDENCGEHHGLRRESKAGLLALNQSRHHSVLVPKKDDCCYKDGNAFEVAIAAAAAEDVQSTGEIANTVHTVESPEDCEMSSDCKASSVDCISLDHDHSHNHKETDDFKNESIKNKSFGDSDFCDLEACKPTPPNPPSRAASVRASIRKSVKAAYDVDGDNESSRHIRKTINYGLCAEILLGDGFHNYADGIFVGVGFLLCSRDVALSILFVTLYHEIAQELADFFLLTKHGGLTVPWALGLNFLSGLFVTLGGITVLSLKTLTAQAVGIILAVAAGVYLHIAASECIPRLEPHLDSWKDRVLAIFMFVLGAVPIGLALLNHQHCDGSH